MFNFIMFTISIVILTFFTAYDWFFSPKARIKGLWKEIFKISFEIGKLKKADGSDAPASFVYPYEQQIKKRGRLINCLLEYHFDPEEDADYIQENKYSEENKRYE